MPLSVLVVVLLVLVGVAYQFGRRRSITVVGGPKDAPKLHSLPIYYGTYTALWAGLPALLVLGIWLMMQSSVIVDLVVAELPREIQERPNAELNLVVNDIKNLFSSAAR